MSVQYHKEIFSNEHLKLKVNFFGLKDDIASAESLSMSIYSYNNNGQPIFSETLNFDQIRSLYDHLNQISIVKKSGPKASSKFLESTDEIVDIVNKFRNVSPELLEVILSKLKTEDKIESLVSFLSENEINTISAIQHYRSWIIEIENLKKLLAFEEAGNLVEQIKTDSTLSEYRAGQPEKIFQNWIEKNYPWVFGVDYIKKHDVRAIALHSEGDLLMESMEGFLDLIELKRPSHNIFGPVDQSHKSYYPSTDLSKVIGQCLFYLQKMDDMKLVLEKEYKTKVIRPRIKIIIGRTKDFIDEQYNALRMLNCQLTHLEIISYDDIIKYGEKMIALIAEEKKPQPAK
jgi:hypothetical protein